MPLKNLGLIKPKNKSKVISGTAAIMEQLDLHFGKVQNKTELKQMPSFILFVCCLVEEAYCSKRNKENQKVNKKEEVLKVIQSFVNVNNSQLTEPEKKQISEIIEDLHSSNRIKQVSSLSKTFYFVTKFFLQ